MAGLKGILKWTLQQAETSDGTVDNAVKNDTGRSGTTEKDRAWLNEVMQQMFADQVDVLKECVDALKGDESNPQNSDAVVKLQERALDQLMDVIDNIDYARDLGAIGGLEPLLKLLSSPHETLRQKSANVLGTIVQNAPACQQWALDHDALECLMAQIVLEPMHSKTFGKLLFALGSLLRGYRPSLEAFFQRHDGLEHFLRWTTADLSVEGEEESRVGLVIIRKVVFLIHSILGDFPDMLASKDGVVLMNTIVPYMGYTKNDSVVADEQTKDVAQQAILSFVLADKIFTEALLGSFPSLFDALEQNVKTLKGLVGEEAEFAMYELERCEKMLTVMTGNIPLFEPTEEWKKIAPGQRIPGGLEVRADFQTGEKFARKIPPQ